MIVGGGQAKSRRKKGSGSDSKKKKGCNPTSEKMVDGKRRKKVKCLLAGNSKCLVDKEKY